MRRLSKTSELERQIRASKPYHDWVKRNKASICLKCDSTENLECHHVVSLYHIILGLWKLHGNEKEVLIHAIDMHSADMCESVTLCNKCHGVAHPGRYIKSVKSDTWTDIWTTLPRNLKVIPSHAKTDRRKKAVGLIAYQTLIGINWYILNGHMDSRIIEFNRRRFAELIGKSPCSSFNHSLDHAIRKLKLLDIILGSHRRGNNIEIHISKDYLQLLVKNPWFFPLDYAHTNSMCILTLRLFLGMQSRKIHYRIGIEKIRNNLGILDTNNHKTTKRITKACESMEWANVAYDNGMCDFKLKKRRATPIHSLRNILDDSIQQGM